MPQRQPVPLLTGLCLASLGRWVKAYCDRVAQVSFELAHGVEGALDGGESAGGSERVAGQWVERAIQALPELLFAGLPWHTHQALSDTLLEVLGSGTQSSRAFYRYACPKTIHEAAVTVKFIQLVVRPTLRRLDLSRVPKAVREMLYRHLSQLRGLQVLNLGSGGPETSHPRLFLALKYLHDLRSLTVSGHCQNEMLALVGQNCSQLVALDISGSTRITPESVLWLRGCQSLTHLNLYGTNLTVQTYAQLLLALPHLKSLGRCDELGQVLQYWQTYNDTRIVLALEVCHSREIDADQLSLLPVYCPRLVHVNLCLYEDIGGFLAPLRDLPALRELKLMACGFYLDGISQFLTERGCQLTLLHLEHTDEIDMKALCAIARHCPHLEQLVLFSCDFDENFGQVCADTPFPHKPFQHLKELVCVSESAPNIIEFLLTHADQLERIKFGSSAWFNDEIVERLVAKNVMKRVEELRILRSYELTMKSVDLLLDHCPQLRVLAEVDGWEGISEAELMGLRRRVQAENLLLDTHSSWGASL